MNRFFPEGILYERADNKEKISSAEGLKEAEAKKTILEGRVSLCDFNHNLFVDLPAMKGIIPREEGAIGIKEGTVRDIALISRVSHPVCFTVTGVTVGSDGRPLAVLSRRNAQQLCMDNYIESLSCGDIIDAKITHLEPFGAFCDIGCGIVSLMSIDCISVSRIFHPADRFFVGQHQGNHKIKRTRRKDKPFPQGASRHLGTKRRVFSKRADRFGHYQDG